jgi:hypothetical protein
LDAGFILWDLTGWYEKYALASKSRVVEEQKREGWEMAVRIEKIIAAVLDEAYGRQVEEVMDVPSEGPEEFYK